MLVHIVLAVLCLTVAASATAQTVVVATVKDELVARGVSILGPCGALEITRRVAWRLRESGAGLYAKVQGNNCQGFAVDLITYSDGRLYDILVNAENENVPTWNLVNAGTRVPGTNPNWRPVTVDPDSGVSPVPPVDPAWLQQLLDNLHNLDTALEHLQQKSDHQFERQEELGQQLIIEEHVTQDQLHRHDNEQPMWLRKVLTNPTVLAVIGGLLTGKFALGK